MFIKRVSAFAFLPLGKVAEALNLLLRQNGFPVKAVSIFGILFKLILVVMLLKLNHHCFWLGLRMFVKELKKSDFELTIVLRVGTEGLNLLCSVPTLECSNVLL